MKNNQTIAQFLGIKTFPFEIKNDQGNRIYSEYSSGYWIRCEYDTNGTPTRSETSTGYWELYEFDSKKNRIYYENSNGYIIDDRPKQVELTLAEIASKLNIPLELLRIKE